METNNRIMSTTGEFSVASGRYVVYFCFHFCTLTSRPFIPLARKPVDVSFRLAVDLSWLTESLSNLQNNLRGEDGTARARKCEEKTNQKSQIRRER